MQSDKCKKEEKQFAHFPTQLTDNGIQKLHQPQTMATYMSQLCPGVFTSSYPHETFVVFHYVLYNLDFVSVFSWVLSLCSVFLPIYKCCTSAVKLMFSPFACRFACVLLSALRFQGHTPHTCQNESTGWVSPVGITLLLT